MLYTFTGGINGGSPLCRCRSATRRATSTGLLPLGRHSSRGASLCTSSDTAGQETILYNFEESRPMGETPLAGVIRDAAGNLYGTTDTGRLQRTMAVVYELEMRPARRRYCTTSRVRPMEA